MAAAVVAVTAWAAPISDPQPQSGTTRQANKAELRGLAKRELGRFMENAGQWPNGVQFLGRAPGLDYWVTQDGLVLDHYRVEKGTKSGQVVRMSFANGSGAAASTGVSRLKGITQFVKAAKPEQTATASSYAEIRSDSIYPGIDLRSYFEKGQPRYDLIVEPGIDPLIIALRFEGAESVSVTDGDLVLKTSIGEVKHTGLYAYQMVGAERRRVGASFKMNRDGTVGFALNEYDPNRELVIDPLVYGSYYGGDSGFDEVKAVVSDASGVYLTGWTWAPDYPAIYGPYAFNKQGLQDAFVSKLQGDAYSHDYSAYINGSVDEIGEYIQLDPFGNVWVAGRTTSSDFPTNTRPNVMFIEGDPLATGGTIELAYGNSTVNVPYNASADLIFAALDSMPVLSGKVESVTGGPLPNARVRVQLANDRPLVLQVDSSGTKGGYTLVPLPDGSAQQLTPTNVTGGTFTLTFNGETTGDIPFNATAAQVAAALQALPSVGPGNVVGINGPVNGAVFVILQINPALITGPESFLVVDGTNLTGTLVAEFVTNSFLTVDQTVQSIPDSGTFTAAIFPQFTDPLPYNVPAPTFQTAMQGLTNVGQNNFFVRGVLPLPGQRLTYGGTLTGPQQRPFIDNAGLGPNPVYTIFKPYDMFVLRFALSDTTILDPLPTKALIFGHLDQDEILRGFKVVPKDNPAPNDPVELVFLGERPLSEMTVGPEQVDSWLLRVNYGASGTFSQQSGSQYLQGTQVSVSARGLAIDDEGSAYVVGIVATPGVVDTAVSPRFVTTPGVFEFGRLLRVVDGFIRKYDRAGNLMYSALLGGNGSDGALAVAVDGARNAYITGIARSFNFPRTRDVFGENFRADALVFVTKINQDASQLLYSTHLNTTNAVVPAGIAVDQAGRAFVTVNVGFNVIAWSGDPPVPTTVVMGTIPTSPDAMQATNVQPTLPQYPSLEGGLLVLSPNARTLVHGTYIGGLLDDGVNAPFVDRFGDVWVMGYHENFRNYVLYSSTGTPTFFTLTTRLPAQWISATAFKVNPDALGTTTVNRPFGVPPTYPMDINRDGFLVKVRFGLTSILDVTFDPAQIAGGLGNAATGTVTLTQPAPAGGLDVTLTIINPAGASFSVAGDVSTAVITIPGGATTGTFQVFPKAVSVVTPVEVKASAEGNFAVGVLTVTPWLASLSISPNTVVGGNAATGRVRLFEPAPTGGVNVTLTTNNAGLVLVPAVVTVPEGQDSVPFTIDTNGVMNVSAPTVTASLFGVGRTETITLLPPSLATLTFTPGRVAGGSSSTGRLTLNGKAGGNFTVNLSIDAGTAGYTITPSTLTFANGDTFKEFTVTTAYEATDTQRRITATRPAQGGLNQQAISGTLFIDAVALTTFTVDKVALNLGENGTGTITINRPAPAGGVQVALSVNSNIVEVPSQVVVPVGETEVTFNYRATTRAVVQNTTVTITATRGPVILSRNVTVLPTTLSVTVDPFLVVAGTSAQGTVRLGAAAPTGGIVVALSSNTTGVNVPATVTIPANQTTATFTVTTAPRTSDVVATIRATTGTLSAQTTLNVLAEYPFDILGVQFDQPSVMGGMNVTCTVTIDAPAPPAGLVIQLESSNSRVVPVPATITVQNGKVVATFTINTAKVSRDLSVRVTARYKDSVASGVLQVRRR